jgi:hypothetical protein
LQRASARPRYYRDGDPRKPRTRSLRGFGQRALAGRKEHSLSRRRRHRQAGPHLVAAAGLLALALGLAVAPATPPAGAQSDPVAEADAAVAAARHRADEAANAYLGELTRSRQLDAQITDLRDGVARMQSRIEKLRASARERAAVAYKRAGQVLPSTFPDSESAMDDARRGVLLDSVNRRDQEAASSLRRAGDELDRQRRELETAKGQQTATLQRLQQEQQQFDAALTRAQDQRRRVAEQQAQQQAAAAAAAAAAAKAPAPTVRTAAAPPAPQPSTSYVPTPGVHPHHDDPFLVCTRQIESGGNYQAYNAAGPYSGAYQFLQSTWNAAANHAGRGDLVGLDPRLASQYDQDDMAWTLYQWQGKGPWGDRC